MYLFWGVYVSQSLGWALLALMDVMGPFGWYIWLRVAFGAWSLEWGGRRAGSHVFAHGPPQFYSFFLNSDRQLYFIFLIFIYLSASCLNCIVQAFSWWCQGSPVLSHGLQSVWA